jgi:hypothetical protein
MIMSISACQNTGMETPASAATVTALSTNELGRVAEMTPAGMPISAANVTAYRASCPVAGRRDAISSVTGRRDRSDWPKSSCAALLTQRRYCTCGGSLSPSCSRSASSCSGGANSPRASSAGSPGVSCMIEKTMMLTPNRTGISIRRRLSTYCPTVS